MSKEIKILLSEDNDGDIVWTVGALSEVKFNTGIKVEQEKVLQYLKKQVKFETAESPGLIMPDINFTGIIGKEVLPVVMLTTSDSEKDIPEFYPNHAKCYITKPVNKKKFGYRSSSSLNK